MQPLQINEEEKIEPNPCEVWLPAILWRRLLTLKKLESKKFHKIEESFK